MNGILTRELLGVRGEQTEGYLIALADAVDTPIGFIAKTLYLILLLLIFCLQTNTFSHSVTLKAFHHDFPIFIHRITMEATTHLYDE